MIADPKKIIISRTDSIGDVSLTLPLAGILKEKFPDARIVFLGNTYTRPVIECCAHVDEIWEWAELAKKTPDAQQKWLIEQKADTIVHVFPRKELATLAKKAGIRNRIGTSHRFFHWLTCNYRPSFTRKNSDLHEAQLNTKLLQPFGIERSFSLAELSGYASFNRIPSFPGILPKHMHSGKKNLILHPKSQGSAAEWGIDNFMALSRQLDPSRYTVFFTGTAKEGELFRHLIPHQENIVDLTGQLTLAELIGFIAGCDGLLAASTGPLHLAGLTGIHAFGLFRSQRPIHPGRWQPIGNKVVILEEKNFSSLTQPLNIPLREVLQALEERL